MELERIESLLKLMKEYGVVELGLEEKDSTIQLSMVGSAPAPVAVTQAPAVAVPSSPAAEAAPAPVSNSVEVKSPMVGTFYSSPKPGSPAFVKVGDRVGVGEVLCIVEAMKLMNEIESETAGTIAEICVENSGPVQFGQVLFRIDPE